MTDFLPLAVFDQWDALSPNMQDALLFGSYLLPCLIVGPLCGERV